MEHEANVNFSERFERGDIIEFTVNSTPRHWGIYIGDGIVAHVDRTEDSEKNVVCIDKLEDLKDSVYCHSNNTDSFFRSPNNPEQIVLLACNEIGNTTSLSSHQFVNRCRYGRNIKMWLWMILLATCVYLMSNEFSRKQVIGFLPMVEYALFVMLFLSLIACVLTHMPGQVYVVDEKIRKKTLLRRKLEKNLTVDLAMKKMYLGITIGEEPELVEMDPVISSKLKLKKGRGINELAILQRKTLKGV